MVSLQIFPPPASIPTSTLFADGIMDDISNLQVSFLATVDKLDGIYPLSRDEGFILQLVLVRITESHVGKRGFHPQQGLP